MDKSIRQAVTAFSRKRATRRVAIGLGAFLLLFWIFGYFFLPGIIKTKIEQQLTEKLNRPTTIGRIEISPYTLAVNIHQFKAMEPDGKKTFVSFEKLRVSLSMQSLFRFAPVIQELKVDKPYVHLARTAANRYSIDDILKLISDQPPSDEPSRFSVYNIQIEDGKIEFEDQPKNKTHTVTNLEIGIPFVSSLPSQVDVFVEPFLNANINGSTLQIKGKARPFAESKETIVDFNLDNINLTRYLEYLPYKPRFKLHEATLGLHLSANFKQAIDQSPALLLKGDVTFKNVHITELDDAPMVRLPELKITINGLSVFSEEYNIAKIALISPELNIVKAHHGALNLMHLSPPTSNVQTAKSKTGAKNNEHAIKLALGEFSIKDGKLNFQDRQETLPMSSSLEKFDLRVKDSEINLKNKEIKIAEIKTDSANFNIQYKKRGKAPTIEKSAKESASAKPEWDVSIGKVLVSNWTAQFEDKNLKRRRKTQIAPISLSIDDLSTKHGSKGQMVLEAKVNQKGQITAKGSIGISPIHIALALNLKNVSILPMQPYFTDQLNLQLTRANISTKGYLKLDEKKNGALKGGFKGSMSFSQVATVDKISAKNFVSWRNLSFRGINAKFEPFSLGIGQVTLNRYFARIIVSPNGRINLQDVIRGPGENEKSLTESSGSKNETAAQKAAPDLSAQEENAQQKTTTKMPPIRINKLVLRKGRVRFTDNFIKPYYTANMVDLSGTITGLSSKNDSVATVNLSGKVNSAPLTINGSINPLKGELFLDIKAATKGMELAPLSAYSGKYAGYSIEKGKLSLDVAYKVDQRKLSAENRLVLDQLTFGKKVESPSATKLPVMLAVALLRDRNGVIDIRLPISGSLDDPRFSMGGIIVKAIFNLVAKAITSPFALLGSVFGSGEDLSWLNFEPGTAKISAAAETKLTSLSKALLDRPGLKLEIKGLADPVSDRKGLVQENIKRKVRLLKKKDLISDGEPIPPGGVVVTKKEYPDLLERVYKDEDFPRPRNFIGFLKSIPVPEMEKLMLKNAKVTDNDLLHLGTQRAQSVKAWLIAKKVPAERIYIVASKHSSEQDKQGPSRVDFSLK